MRNELELIAHPTEEGLTLLCPGVGLFSDAVPKGRVLVPGQPAGVLRTLRLSVHLIVPEGAAGRVANKRPERVEEPVDYKRQLYLLSALDGELGAMAASAVEDDAAGPVVRAPYAGRFWHRPAPSDPAYSEPGTVLEAGSAVGLIEVMKTFSQVTYQPAGALPAKGRVLKMLAGDGEEISEGQPLIEVEPA